MKVHRFVLLYKEPLIPLVRTTLRSTCPGPASLGQPEERHPSAHHGHHYDRWMYDEEMEKTEHSGEMGEKNMLLMGSESIVLLWLGSVSKSVA